MAVGPSLVEANLEGLLLHLQNHRKRPVNELSFSADDRGLTETCGLQLHA